MEKYYARYIGEIKSILEGMIVTDRSGQVVDNDEGLIRWAQKAKKVRDEDNGCIFFAGNGASATMAEHFSHDCFQNARITTFTSSETAHLTAIGNDLSFEHIFSCRVERLLSVNDVLVTISSSGNSPNIIKAIEVARKKEAFVITLSGKSHDNKSRSMGDLNFYIPGDKYGLVESAHAVLLHCWLDLFLDMYMGGRH
ncbi:D-sedoheptulose 7-phosphate isomerase [Paenibacillus cellulosilyticus]|uniref:D-sedoheptulose 7-phosphate isomerase n=1 Tax=Paenibacillus cellulosilyticus TaxID=375489 RepID=A0A2V2Z8B2_9BACL|nr:SIS domain-containing protein [Paenibacillus cellulosilyticus]PWW08331.1 D-sedoheptulose 7-phosphate isomerase [Paenibacillus cellulosilyticus]QKS47930.1 SIS domain-containing protein [Paenibacillus cellulosilyticus]